MARTYTSEKDVKKRVKELLNRDEWFWWMPPANGFGKVGVSDFNALKNGVFLAIETKFGGNTPTPQQKAYLQSIHAAGGLAFLVDEKNIEWLDIWLQTFARSVKKVSLKEAVPDADGAAMLDAVSAMTKGVA